ncbi:hypothetical protein FGG08_007696, partial [Glutinoglossum americanum]
PPRGWFHAALRGRGDRGHRLRRATHAGGSRAEVPLRPRRRTRERPRAGSIPAAGESPVLALGPAGLRRVLRPLLRRSRP